MLLQAIRNCSKAIELDPEYLKVKCYLDLSLLILTVFALFLQKQMFDIRSNDDESKVMSIKSPQIEKAKIRILDHEL